MFYKLTFPIKTKYINNEGKFCLARFKTYHYLVSSLLFSDFHGRVRKIIVIVLSKMVYSDFQKSGGGSFPREYIYYKIYYLYNIIKLVLILYVFIESK